MIHSKTSPSASIIIKIRDIGKRIDGLVVAFAAGSGNSRAISKSNNKNKIATRKNRNENGSRAEFNGSNPHSYGEVFSLSTDRLGRMCAAAARTLAIAAVVKNIKIIVVITYI